MCSAWEPGPLTWVGGQVGEPHGLAVHAVRDAAEHHVHGELLADVLVAVRRRLEHDGDLPVDVRLGELPLPLPGVAPEDDLDVVWGGGRGGMSERVCCTSWHLKTLLSSGQRLILAVSVVYGERVNLVMVSAWHLVL